MDEISRKTCFEQKKLECVQPLTIPGFRLYDFDIDTICNEDYFLTNDEDQIHAFP